MKSEIRIADAKMIVKETGVWIGLRLPFASREPAREFCEKFKTDKQYSAVLKEIKEKRSLDQNAYYWTLCGKLAEKLNIAPIDIYREHIKDIGGNFEITPIKKERVAAWIKVWEHQGDGFLAVDMGESKIAGYTNIRNYFGSSTYDKTQMAKLLDLMVRDCKENDILTELPEKIAEMGETQ